MASISSMETVMARSPSTDDPTWHQVPPNDGPSRAEKGKERAPILNMDYELQEAGSRPHSPFNGEEIARRYDMEASGRTSDYGDSDDGQTVDAGVYPPTTDQEAETRRVEETLRRWEIAERQRRKNARLSSTADGGTQAPPKSRPTSFWSSAGYPPHRHTVLQSEDSLDVVPLEAVSPCAAQNPFDSSDASPFADSNQPSAVMNPSSDLSLPSTHRTAPSPPKPLGLPAPRTPPPPIHTPPNAKDTPSLHSDNHSTVEQDPPRVRWWHEWLCGCGEGPDRGGHDQAGRTNPFE